MNDLLGPYRSHALKLLGYSASAAKYPRPSTDGAPVAALQKALVSFPGQGATKRYPRLKAIPGAS
jgi:hypothetical protein